MQESGPDPKNKQQSAVVLVHGHGSHPVRMAALARAARGADFHVLNFGYPSTRLGFDAIAQRLIAAVQPLEAAYANVHYITHSMGGLVVRRMLALRPEHAPGRIVMIAPPNQGAALARRMLQTRTARALAGPAACEMADAGPACFAPHSGPSKFATPGAPVMIIAGTQRFSPLSINAWASAALRIHGHAPGDGTIAVHETSLPLAAHTIQIHDHHAHLVSNPKAIHAAIHFLNDCC